MVGSAFHMTASKRRKPPFMPACMEGLPLPPKNPRLMCNRLPSFRRSPHRFPISHPTPLPPHLYRRHPPGLLDPSPLERCPETWVMDGDSWWTSQNPSYEGPGQTALCSQVTHLAGCSVEALTALQTAASHKITCTTIILG